MKLLLWLAPVLHVYILFEQSCSVGTLGRSEQEPVVLGRELGQGLFGEVFAYFRLLCATQHWLKWCFGVCCVGPAVLTVLICNFW